MVEQLNTDTYTVQEKKQQQQITQDNHQKFLNDEKVKQLESVFQANFSKNSIKKIGDNNV